MIGFAAVSLMSCEVMPGADAKKYPPNPDLRVKKNLEEGRGFRLDDAFKNKNKGGDFMFASSNELWRASLDIIDFMPLSSVNYSGGIIITDWYSDGKNLNEAVKISIRFLSNEVRADALNLKIFYKKCNQMASCAFTQKKGPLLVDLKTALSIFVFDTLNDFLSTTTFPLLYIFVLVFSSKPKPVPPILTPDLISQFS